MSEPDPFTELTDDPAAARVLRESLTTLREQHEGTPLAALLTRVLDGRTPVRALADDPAFRELADAGMRHYEAEVAELDPEQRRALVAQGRAHLAELREDDAPR